MPLTDDDKRRLVAAIHAEPELDGCIVGFQGHGQSMVLHSGRSMKPAWNRVMVVIEVAPAPIAVGAAGAGAPTVIEKPALSANANQGKITAELWGAGASCFLAVVSGVGVAGAAALEVPSAGTSTFLLVMAWGGLATSGAQCINGIVRSVEAVSNPEDDSLYRWDNDTVYQNTFLIVDGLGLAFGLASLPAQGRNLLRVLQRRGALTSADDFAKLAPGERRKAIQAAVEKASRSDAGRKELTKAMREAGLKQNQIKTAFEHGTKSVRQGTKVLGAISKDAAQRIHGHVLDIAATSLGAVMSGTSSEHTGSGSGAVNALIVHVTERD